MPIKSQSFHYIHDGLTRGINTTSYYDYYNRLIDRYQNDRSAIIKKEGTFDDNQLVKERYTDPAKFISHTKPLSNTTLLFVNRRNGYIAYTNEIPEKTLDPIAGLDFITVNTYFEYLARVKGTMYEGFFYLGNQLSCYAIVGEDIDIITANGNIPLLFFTESFYYSENTDKSTGIIGTAILKSPYFSDITLNVYTEESVTHLEKYAVYAKTSNADPNPINKVPGEPIYKTFVINEFDNNVTKIKIDEIIIDTTSNLNTVILGNNTYFYDQYIAFKYTGNGEIEVGFTFPLNENPLETVDFTINLFINGSWSNDQITTVYFSDNHFSSLTPLISVDPQELYLDVPTIHTLRISPHYFFENWKTKNNTDLYFLDKQLNTPLHFLKKENMKYVYQTDSIIISSEEGKKPDEYKFVITDIYDLVNGFRVPVWFYGYTTTGVNPIPNDYILVKSVLNSDFTYTEYEKKEYRFDFSWEGNITVEGIELRKISDDYQYFSLLDFKLEKVSLDDKKATYKLILDKKIIKHPIAVTQIPMKILFRYKIVKKDLSADYWPGETMDEVLTLTYVKDRWELTDVAIDQKLLGRGTITYKLKDKLLNMYTDKYTDDERLIPEGEMVFSPNVSKTSTTMDWDVRLKMWSSSVNILGYGDITVQFKGVNAQSNVVTLSHALPTHPLTITPVSSNGYVYVMTRTVINLKYNDKIKTLYIDGTIVDNKTLFKMDNVKGGYGYISPIYNPTKTEIIAVGLDFIPLKQQDIPVTINFTQINDYNYENWIAKTAFTIPVKPQREKANFVFILGEDFKFGEVSSGKLKLNDILLEDGSLIGNIKNASTGEVVAKPNFNPVGNGDFETINIFIDASFSTQKQYYLDFQVTEDVNASKDNALPFQLYYLSRISFKVP